MFYCKVVGVSFVSHFRDKQENETGYNLVTVSMIYRVIFLQSTECTAHGAYGASVIELVGVVVRCVLAPVPTLLRSLVVLTVPRWDLNKRLKFVT